MSPLTSYTKIIFSLSLLCGLSVSLFSQGFIDRRIDSYISKINTGLLINDDTILTVGFGLIKEEPFSAQLNITNYNKDGSLINDTIIYNDSLINYVPWLQGSTKKINNHVIISGSGGEGFSAVNQAGFISKYNIDTDSIEWVYNIEPDVFSSNSIVVETEVLSSDNIVGVMIESLDTFPLNSYVRFLKWDQNGNLINEKIIDDNGFRYTARSLLLNNENELILGLDVVQEGLPLNLQLWKLDTLGNILDVYETGEDDNGLKCNKIIQSADGGYLFVDRVLESDNGLPHYSSRITKLSANFEKEWDQKVGNIEFRTELFNIKPTNDGNYIAVGISVEENENGIAPAHMIKIDDNGNVLWESFIDVDITLDNGPTAISANSLYDVIELDEGGFIACGQSLGFNVDSFPQQALLIRVDEKGQLNHIFFTPPPNLEPLIVYPNPVQSNLFIKEEDGPLSYEIISIQGSVIRQGNYKNNEGIDISFLTNGLYIVRMENGRKASFMVKK